MHEQEPSAVPGARLLRTAISQVLRAYSFQRGGHAASLGVTLRAQKRPVPVTPSQMQARKAAKKRQEETMGKLGDVSVAKTLWIAGVSFAVVALWTWYMYTR